MRRIPGWLLPLVLAVTQLAAWPGAPLLAGDRLSAPAVATGVTATLVVAVALLWRRSAPPAVTAIVIVALTVGTFGVPTDALAIISIADVVALYGVSVWCSQRLTLGFGVAVVLWQCTLVAAMTGTSGDYPAEAVIILILYATVVAVGRARHRWHAERAAAAQRLAEAEDRRARAADTERHRLARELHDVTAHHLTSIVVIASAAQRLGASRPDLVAEARDFAARTGRDTLAALHRLVALLRLPDERPGPVAGRLAELAEGFRLLGQRVSVRTAAPDLPPAATEAVCGIAREALTNTLRYAPASNVRIELATAAGGDLELTVDDDGARAAGVADVGSGRGIAGMRERATALGGTLAAGPRPGGGWRIHAVLPQATAPAPARRRLRWPGSEHVLDVVLALLALATPVLGLLSVEDPEPMGTPVPLLLLVAAAHVAPVLWRRTRPWLVLGAVAATSWAVPVLIATGPVPPALGWVMPAGLGAEAVAGYAVARYGRPSGVTVLAILAALASAALATGATLALDIPPEDDFPFAFSAIFMAALIGVPLAVPIVGSWLAGFAVQRRRAKIETREHDAVAATTAHAIMEASLERSRVAVGLRAAVLRDTARVATAADAGDLDQVLRSARAALDAMRGLLNGLRDGPDPDRGADERDPQPTTAALPGLADRWRAGGRQVTLELTGTGRALPADVDLSAFRVVELLLAGDTGPVTVRVDLTGDPLRISMRPMPADEGGEIAAGLRARLAAVGGSARTAPDGLPDFLLPAPPAAQPGPASPDRPAGPDQAALPGPPAALDEQAGRHDPAERHPAGGAGSGAGIMPPGERPAGPTGTGPGPPAGDDKEVTSSPSG